MSQLHKAVGRIGRLQQQFGPESSEVATAKTEVQVVRAELAIEAALNSTPAPDAEQIDRLRRLLPAVGTTGQAVAA